MVRIGCSGWNYAHWRGSVYPASVPERRWLETYAQWFDTVEINATFYRLPERKTVARWADATPPGFCFAVKSSRYLTHVKRLRELPAGIERLYERIDPFREADKLGPVLWQLPPRFRRDDDRLAQALDVLPPGRHAFEFRDHTWFAEEGIRASPDPRRGARRRRPRAARSVAVGRDSRLVVPPVPPRPGASRRVRAGRASHVGEADRRGAGRRVRVLQQRLGGLRSRERQDASASPGRLLMHRRRV
jgi:uncharacterized protein YecE (DUF72 family)